MDVEQHRRGADSRPKLNIKTLNPDQILSAHTLTHALQVKYWMGRGADSFMTDDAALSSAHTR